jgi:DNA helicase-2/ATP-dependent DNA helicase PcrA
VNEPVCVVAIPGSGKTLAVVHKISYLLSGHTNGFWTRPKQVLALTYTREAAQGLQNKIQAHVGQSLTRELTTGTFHSIFLNSLKAIGSEVVSRKNLAGADVIKQVMAIAVRRVYSDKPTEHSRIVDRLLKARELETMFNGDDSDIDQVECVMREFDALMKEDSQFDFTMIMRESLKFLTSKGQDVERTPQYRAIARPADFGWIDELPLFVKANHIIVDEAQDLDRIQFNIILKLAEIGITVDIVGDDDQSLYGFRGGLGHHGMTEFMDSTGAHLVKFEKNFRSKVEILELAQKVIDQNEHRIPKTLHPFHGRGNEGISLDEFETVDREVDFIVRAIATRLLEDSKSKIVVSLDMAILARHNNLLDNFEAKLKSQSILHYRAAKESIWSKLPLVGFLAFLEDPTAAHDKGGTRQCLEWAGIDSDAVDCRSLQVTGTLAVNSQTLVRSLATVRGFVSSLNSGSSDEDVTNVVGHLYAWALIAIDLNGSKEKGWSEKKQATNRKLAMWGAKTLGGQHAVDIGDHAVDQYISKEPGEMQVSGFTGPLSNRISALKFLNKKCEDKSQGLKLLTMHGSKGLEFDEVWLAGCDDATIPGEDEHGGNLPEWQRIEEERRILYVGVTRAKRILHLSYSQFPDRGNRCGQPQQRSRFLNVIDTHRLATRQLFIPPTDFTGGYKV